MKKIYGFLLYIFNHKAWQIEKEYEKLEANINQNNWSIIRNKERIENVLKKVV